MNIGSIYNMRKAPDKEKILDVIIRYLKNKKAKKIFLFGSFLRDEEEKDSDIDLIVEFKEPKSLIEHIAIERELSEKIGRKIDLLTEKAISPYLIYSVKSESKLIYDEKR